MINQNRWEQRQEQHHAQAAERVNDLVSQAFDLPQESAPNVPAAPKFYTVTLRFTGIKEKLEALKVWMSQNGISYEKVGQNDGP
jgi:hypothetical protein